MTRGDVQTSQAEPISLLFVVDDEYAPHLATALRSVSFSNHRSAIEVYVVELGVGEANRQLVERSAAGLRINWLHLDKSALAGLPPSSGGVHNSAYALLIAPSLLPPNLERVLALDVDLLVRADLTPLWTFDFDGALAAGVRDSVICWMAHPTDGLPTWRLLGLDGRLPYLNTGAVLLDLAEWRRRDLTNRCLDYLEEYGSTVRFGDQDALNAVLGGQWRSCHRAGTSSGIHSCRTSPRRPWSRKHSMMHTATRRSCTTQAGSSRGDGIW